MSQILPPFQLLELNVISAQELAPVGRSMRTYAVSYVHPDRKLSTRVDTSGHTHPTWNDKFVFRVDEEFLYSDTSAIMIEIYALHWFKDIHVGTVRVLVGNLIPPPERPFNNDRPMEMRFVALQVRRPSGRPQGILNVGVAVLDSSMRSMPLYTLNASAVGYRHLMGETDAYHNHNHLNPQVFQNNNNNSNSRPELRRSKSDNSSLIATETAARRKRNVINMGKPSSDISCSELSAKSEENHKGHYKNRKKKKPSKPSSVLSGVSGKSEKTSSALSDSVKPWKVKNGKSSAGASHVNMEPPPLEEPRYDIAVADHRDYNASVNTHSEIATSQTSTDIRQERGHPPVNNIAYEVKASPYRNSQAHYKNSPAPEHFRNSPAPEHFRNSPAPAHFKNSPAPEHFRNSPAPEHFRNSPAPAHFKNSPALEHFRNSPAPEHFRNSPAPEHFRNSPAPEQFRKSPAPAHFRNSPAPEHFRNSPAPEHFRNSPAPEHFRNSPAPEQFRNSPMPQFKNSPMPQYLNSPKPQQFANSPKPQFRNSPVVAQQFRNSPAMSKFNPAVGYGGSHRGTPLRTFGKVNSGFEYATPMRSNLGNIRPLVMTESELGPSPSEVAAAMARKPIIEEGDLSTVGGWSLDESVEGLQSKLERWRTELPPVIDQGELSSFPTSSTKTSQHTRRHTDGGGTGSTAASSGNGLFSCFSTICGIECSIVCGGDKGKKKGGSRRRTPSVVDSSSL